MRYSTYYKYLLPVFFCICLFSCKKYLDEKPDQSLSTPSTLDDLQALLDNTVINYGAILSNVGSDEYYLLFADWQSRGELDMKGHIWSAETNDFSDWNNRYASIFTLNTVLDNIDKVDKNSGTVSYESVLGSALFHRAYAFFQMAQLFAPQYDSSSFTKDLGIVLRLNSNFNEISKRSTVKETYERIVADVEKAASLLPVVTNYKTRPSKAAALGFLARVYLQMGNYSKAKEAASSCLQLYSTLLDFNNKSDADTLSSVTNPIKMFNAEVIFHSGVDGGVSSTSRAKVDSNLYKSYVTNDLRRLVYFRKNSDNYSYRFKGSYNSGSTNLFCGIATDEIYLIRAECNARLGNTSDAMTDLNTLLVNRWKKGTFVSLIAGSPDKALEIILAERKKELLLRGTRWPDLRRLNKDPRFAVTITRNMNGQTYSLPPNDNRYTLLIPVEVMSKTSLQQNPR